MAANNPFLFALPNLQRDSHICGYKALQKFARFCGAKNPEALTSTKLRKHLATITQLFNMTESDLEQLANFKGHTLGVHKNSYRLPDDIYQTTKISKLLYLMEKGDAAQYKGKDQDEMDLNLDEDLLENIDMQADTEPNIIKDIDKGDPPDSSKNIHFPPSIPAKKKRILVAWSSEQKDIMKEYFKQHINSRKLQKGMSATNCEKNMRNYSITRIG